MCNLTIVRVYVNNSSLSLNKLKNNTTSIFDNQSYKIKAIS